MFVCLFLVVILMSRPTNAGVKLCNTLWCDMSLATPVSFNPCLCLFSRRAHCMNARRAVGLAYETCTNTIDPRLAKTYERHIPFSNRSDMSLHNRIIKLVWHGH
jgi:hypothetical protein